MVTVSYNLKSLSSSSGILIEKTILCKDIVEAMKFLDKLRTDIQNKYTIVGKPVVGERRNESS